MLHKFITRRIKTLNPYISLSRSCHSKAKNGFDSSNQTDVAIFWDLDNKPPNSFPPFEAAIKLKTAASSFGVVKSMVAYANHHSLTCVPKAIREKRRERKYLDKLENKGLIKSVDPYVCEVCGRRFYTNERLVNHFRRIHEREHRKRLNQIESARGSRRMRLVEKYSMKMEKFKDAARDVLIPKIGYGLADELERAGFRVGIVSNKPQAADVALKDHMVDVMDKREAECLMLVSDDSDFVCVLKEAKLRCLKTVIVGDGADDGALKRVADVGFSWTEILNGNVKKKAISVVDVSKKLEWTYDPEVGKKLYASEDLFDDEDEDLDFGFDSSDHENGSGYMHKDDTGAWWRLDSESDVDSSESASS